MENLANFLDPDEDLKQNCRRVVYDMFHEVTSTSSCNLAVSMLHFDGFGLNDIWEQIDLINKPILKMSRKPLDYKPDTRGQHEGYLANEDDDMDGDDDSDGDDDDDDNDDASGDELYFEDFFDPNQEPPNFEDISEHDDIDELSSHQTRQNKMTGYISNLEELNISEKKWQMSGEVTSRGRDENTLLEEDVQFEHVSRPAPDITNETTMALEDIIKQRIKHKIWDDVIRKVKPKDKPFNYKVVHRLDEEKSKLSLAEVYEKEYIKQTQKEKANSVNPKHKEIENMLKKLFDQLDALTNFHYVPRVQLEPEIKAVPLVPSIMMEEVMPIAQSTGISATPKEIQTSKHS
jgi:U3 small nucleolar RNA-associated protein MPP10